MKKTLAFAALIIFSFFLLSGFSFSVGDGIDRSESLKYPNFSSAVNEVYVNIKYGNVYHRSRHCDVEEILLGLSIKDHTKMSAYEAVLRGFLECPDCHRCVSDIYNEINDIQFTVDAIYDVLD